MDCNHQASVTTALVGSHGSRFHKISYANIFPGILTDADRPCKSPARRSTTARPAFRSGPSGARRGRHGHARLRRSAKRPQQPHSVCLFICILDRAPHPTRKERRTSQAPFCISFVVRFVGSAHDAVSSCGAALSLPPQRLGWRSRRDAEHRSAARLITPTGAGEVVWAAPTDQPAGSPTNPGRYRRARNPIPIARSRTGHAAPVIRTGLNRIGTPISVAMRLRAEPRRARPEPASTGRA